MSQEHPCPVETCEQSFDSKKGLGSHKGRSHDKKEYLSPEFCHNCGEKIFRVESKRKKSDNAYCSNECKFEASKTALEVNCDYCGEEYEEYESRIERSDNSFCSRKCHNNWRSENIVGQKHPNWNRIVLECCFCGSSFERKPSRIRSKKSFCSRDCLDSWQKEKFTGETNPRFSGGDSKDYGYNWDEQRHKRLLKDNYCCVRCGISNEKLRSEKEYSLDVHHIVPIDNFNGDFDSANDISNLVSLCRSCHCSIETLSVEEQKKILCGE
jgi:5-methylcytosine-specific restriction endonuclease McrA/predicted RNA-binding Zn-ribbon protein involved in translation (DUF1610 family)